jgi:hypothetical protein
MTGWAVILDAAKPEARAFAKACDDPRSAQIELLKHILRTNAECEFGRDHAFYAIRNLDDYRARVPIRRYGAFQPWLNRAIAGESSILSSEPIVVCEETGGSTAGGKLIPYTKPALHAFRAAVLPWLFDLSRRRPGVVTGKAYVAVSPATRAPRATPGGHPIGLPSEGAYLGNDLVSAFIAVSAMPHVVGLIRDVTAWRFATLFHLLKAADLTFISVWSPTFLIVLMDALPALAPSLIRAVHDGRIPVNDPALARQAADPDPQRARQIEAALSAGSFDTAAIWPRLDSISAWTDGSSRMHVHRLRQIFPHAMLEPKGLLATEGAVTVPWGGLPHPVPALTSTVVEFIDDSERAYLCDELVEGAAYRVVITTPGGLYRYDLGDRVRCRAIANGLPQLEFIGRAEHGSDMVGEKLTEEFVAGVLVSNEVPAVLVAHGTESPFYELLVQTTDPERATAIAAATERRLHANPQYGYARSIGQLGPLRSRAVPDLLEKLMANQSRRGRRVADVKPPVLICDAALRDLLTKHLDEKPEGGGPTFPARAGSCRMTY